MDRFIRELEIGEIYQRNKWQFELKSEFIPSLNTQENIYTQEFYFFIPNSLQINEETYHKSQFYQDRTNLIRYKTPKFELKELCDTTNTKSPLNRLSVFCNEKPSHETLHFIKDELKLLANSVRSSIRERVGRLVMKKTEEQILKNEIQELCEDLKIFRHDYLSVQSDFIKKWASIKEQSYFLYIDEFLSETVDYYLIGLLDHIKYSNLSNRKEITKVVSEVILQEKYYREHILKKTPISEKDTLKNESILYTKSLLNKFVADALLLHTVHASVVKRFQNLIGSFAAAIAMLVFFVLFTTQSNVLIINSFPFIVLTVLLYVLKDRIKESLKNLSYHQFAKWFSDYKTEIFSPDGSKFVGKMGEYISFIHQKELPEDIKRVRNREFHAVLEAFTRPEQVLYYKKQIKTYTADKSNNARRRALNIVFHFNIERFLQKADDPSHDYITMDPETLELYQINIPKVYHLNMIMKNMYFDKDGNQKNELKKFRLILDKNGIKRIEHISTQINA